MVSQIMEEWLKNLDRKMTESNRKIILILDNAPVHPHLNLCSVKLLFLPPNTTSHTQPLDAGIIRTFKCFYRKLVVNYLLQQMEIDENESSGQWIKNLNVSNAVNWISKAWDDVKVESIVNCFTHCGIGGIFFLKKAMNL
jgi:hypothetical protein